MRPHAHHSRRRRILLRTLACILFVVPSLLFAETVYLKNGQVLNGKIIAQSRTQITINAGGQTRTIKKDDIRRISYDNNSDAAKKAEEERKRKEAERKRVEEQKQLEEQKRLEEEKRLEEQKNSEAAKRAEEERRKQEAEERRRREEEERRARDAEGPSLGGALMRSVLLPGWGQYYQGRTGIGIAYMGVMGGLLGANIVADQEYNRYRSNYESNANLFFLTSPLFLSSVGSSVSSPSTLWPVGVFFADKTGDARHKMERSAKYSNYGRTALLGFYLWNLTDVVLFRPAPKQSVSMTFQGDTLGLRYDYRF